MRLRRLLTGVFVFIQLVFLYSQERIKDVKVYGFFQEDSTMVGKPVHFVLTASYPEDKVVIFPDSMYDFSPFEFQKQIWFSTQKRGENLTDSAIYQLTTFELDSVQYLKLPVFDVSNGDSILHFSARAGLPLAYELKQMPQELKLLDEAGYIDPAYPVDFPFIMTILGGISGLALLLIGIFWKKIRSWWAQYSIKRKHRRFLLSFSEKMNQTTSIQSAVLIEELAGEWKKHAAYLTGKPIASYTSRDMIKALGLVELKDDFNRIDRVIYAGINDEPLFSSFEKLKERTDIYYHDRLKEVRNA